MTPEGQGLDRGLLGLYLADHLSGATAGLERARHMCSTYTDLPVHDELCRFRDELTKERDYLVEVIGSVGTHRRPARQAATWLGEKVGRLKLNRRLVSRSPMTPVLELELLRGAVLAKQGLWEVLAGLAPELGLDPGRLAELTARADDQRRRLAEMHQRVRAGAFEQR